MPLMRSTTYILGLCDSYILHPRAKSSTNAYCYACIAICPYHYGGVIMSAMASQITGVSNVCSTVCSGAYQRKHQGSASMAFVRGIHRSPVDSPHKVPVTRKTISLDDVIMRFKPMCEIARHLVLWSAALELVAEYYRGPSGNWFDSDR